MTDDQPGAPDAAPLFSEPGDGEKLGDDGLLAILEEAIADERAAQEKYRVGLERCADRDACRVFEQLLVEEEAHERALVDRYNDVKKRIGLRGAGREQA
jgi:rubrerythrin